MNEKEKELTNNEIELNDLKNQKKILEEELNEYKKNYTSTTKENNELRNKIEKLKKVKIDKD